MQLDQVDVVDAEAVERAVDLFARGRALALAGLRREEEPRRGAGASQGASRNSASPYDAAVSMWLTPYSSSSSSVRRPPPAYRAERRRAEDRARALVAGAPERRFRDHDRA